MGPKTTGSGTFKKARDPRKKRRRDRKVGGSNTAVVAPVCSKTKVNARNLLGTFIDDRVKKLRIKLTPEQHELAVMFAAKLVWVRGAKNDPFLRGFQGWDEIFPRELHPGNGNLFQGCFDLMVKSEFMAFFRVEQTASDWRDCVMLGASSRDEGALTIPFEAIFGEKLSRSVARYVLPFMERPEHNRTFWGGGEKHLWENYARK